MVLGATHPALLYLRGKLFFFLFEANNLLKTFYYNSFFPSQIQPFVAIVSNTIFNLLVKIKVCKKPPKRYNVNNSNTIGAGGPQSHVTITLPLVNAGIENSDAERRR